MGLFGIGKKKETSSQYNQMPINDPLFRELTQYAALLLMKMGISKQPGLMFFKDDRGLLEGLFVQHTTNAQILQLRSMSEDTYVKVCGMHALGAGMYIAHMQDVVKKPLEEFSSEDLRDIANAFARTDAYELALNTLGIPLNSQNKQALDQIYVIGLGVGRRTVGSDLIKPQNIRTYMQVMFNAGVTVAYAQ